MATNTNGPLGPTNFPGGVSTDFEWQSLGKWVYPDPALCHTYWNDFDQYMAATSTTPAEWLPTITAGGTGDASAVITNADGGILLITNDDADNDNYFAQWKAWGAAVAETWKFEAGKKLWFRSRFKVSNATQSDFVMGLQITDTSPLAVTDGVYFLSVDESAVLNLVVTKDSTSTTTAVLTMTDDTYVDVAYVYNGNDAIDIYVNQQRVASSAVTNLPDDEELTMSFGVQNGSAGAKSMSVDFLLVSKER